MRNTTPKNYLLWVLFFLLWNGLGFAQLYIPNKPSFIPPIIDSTETLTSAEKTQLYEKLKNYSDSTSTEIFVMIVPTTQGEDISRYATDLGHQWEIGQKGKDNGIVLLIALEDRKIAIETGYGVEHLLTDALTNRIIEQEIKPQFKAKNYYQGIDNAANAIFKVMKGEYKADKKNKDSNGS
ncbi:MAG: TPM domain-containing protein, partial [Flavobacterium sp.]|nr:TPM domain-containing protein [Flavobacterium sp.]